MIWEYCAILLSHCMSKYNLEDTYWKICGEVIYFSITSRNVIKGPQRMSEDFPEYQGWPDKENLRHCNNHPINIFVVWIDFKNAYIMMPHSWMLERLKMFGVADNIRNFLMHSMRAWLTKLSTEELIIKRNLPEWLVICVIVYNCTDTHINGS